MKDKNIHELLNELLEWANSDEVKWKSVNDLAHYLFKVVEAKKLREEKSEVDKNWNEWKKEKIDIIINGIEKYNHEYGK